MNTYNIIQGDAIAGMRTLANECINTVVTSPPYWGLRDYGHADQLGTEKTPEAYVQNMVEVFREVRRILRNDGTVWLNLGDSYWSNTLSRKDPVESMWGKRPASDLTSGRDNIPTVNKRGGLGAAPIGIKPKDLIGIPWRVAFALQADGWYLRSDIIWHKPNPMPEAVVDRCTKAHEYIFLLSKNEKYFYDNTAIKEKTSVDRTKELGRAVRKRNHGGRTDGYTVASGTVGDVVVCVFFNRIQTLVLIWKIVD
jgi:DNA modification methylase